MVPRHPTPRLLAASLLLVLSGGCSPEQEGRLAEGPTAEPRPSEILLQAVDAGTGEALSDPAFTVRHLVRFPITLDAWGVESVSSTEPYRIEHAVARDSLVVEVRLESDSYHRLDTVLRVPRGGSTGPVTLPLARRLTQPEPSPQEASSRPSTTTPTRPAREESPEAAGPGEQSPEEQAPDPDAGVDRSLMREGDRAFQEESWATATNYYMRMPRPSSPSSSYAQDYARARVRQGISHIQLGEWGGALDALEEAVTLEEPGYEAYLFLAQAQCTVGRMDAGRQTLDDLARLAPTLPSADRATAQALAGFQNANCAYQEFVRAVEPSEMQATGPPAMEAYQSFLRQAEALSPTPPAVAAAMEEARARIQEIRDEMGGGGSGL